MPTMAVARTAPRRRMSAQARRLQLLDVARGIVAERGFQDVSIQAVATQAGVTRPIVYEHFGGLDGLLEEIVEREMSRALEQIEATALGDLSAGDPAELMLDSLSRFLFAVASAPDTWRLVLTPPEGAPASLRRRIVRGRERVLRSLAAAVQPESLPESFSKDPELTARILSAMADEYALMVIESPTQYPPERLLEHARRWLTGLTG